jgi:DNA-binding beta-propeller fold protein YncE
MSQMGWSKPTPSASIFFIALAGSLLGGVKGASAALLAPGDLVIADAAGKIIQINPTTGNQTLIASGGFLAVPTGIRFAPDGSLLVAERGSFGGTGSILRINPTTGAQTQITTGGNLVDPFAVAMAPDGTLFVSDEDEPHVSHRGAVISVNPATGAQQIVSSAGNFFHPQAIALRSNGEILVVDADGPTERGSVIKVNPVTGTQTVLSGAGQFNSPVGLALQGDNIAYVTDAKTFGAKDSAVYRVDLTTGAQTPVYSTTTAATDFIGLAMTSSGSLIIADNGTGAPADARIVSLDPSSGTLSVIASAGMLLHPVDVAVVPGAVTAAPLPRGSWAGLAMLGALVLKLSAQAIFPRALRLSLMNWTTNCSPGSPINSPRAF